jgi:hypothetical protein
MSQRSQRKLLPSKNFSFSALQRSIVITFYNMATTYPEEEVLRSNGATPLYLAIEDTRWGDALDIAEKSPEQIRMWVRSTGTENTTFDWSLWRRLPIHEVSFDCL